MPTSFTPDERDARERPRRLPFAQAGAEDTASAITPGRRSPRSFFALVFALAIPFWVIGAAAERQLLPGLPTSALMAVCPLLAALILVNREDGTAGVKALLGRALDYDRIGSKVWYVPALLLMPAIGIVSYWVMRAVGLPLPPPRVPVLAAPVLFLAFFAGAVCEEVGWSGYVTDPMQARWSALPAGILLGAVWAAWHVVPLLQAHRSPAWIAWWCLYTVGLRVLTVWLYNNTRGSVFAAALFHATQNVSWQLFPNQGSHFDPRVTGTIVALAAAIVAAVWGPRTLARSP